MKDIRLYIGGVRADLPEDVKIPMNYTLEDRTNPTVVKTSYSKTISLPGTKTNNGIFNFFKLDRTLAYGDSITGANFDPSKRCEFVLYVNGDLFESGYLKLDKVKNVDGKLQYDVTLYGGLGDFFYNLSYGEDGEKKSLSDLYYGVTSDKEAELDFTITKDTVNTAWNRLGSTGNTLWDTINFAPAYNGIPDTIDGKKVLVNTCGTTAFSTAFTEDDVTYETQDGYCMVEMKSEKDEWEMRDLRSHLQRPVVRMKSILNACFNPENNKGETTTGYTVDLDETFFNSDNPYWEDAWVTLPPLSTDAESDVTTSDSDVTFADAVTGPYAGQASTQPLIISGADLNSVSGVLDLSSYPFSYVNLSTVIGLKADVTGTTNNLSLTRYENWNTWIWFWKERWEGRGVAVQMVAYNNDDNRPIAGSDIYILKGNNTDIQPEDFVGTNEGQYNPIFPGAIAGVLGYFKYDYTEHKHVFVADNFTQWQISIQKCPKVEHLKIVLYVQNVYTAAGDNPRGSNGWGWDLMKDKLWDATGSYMATADTRVVCTLAGKASLTEPSSIASGSKLTKSKLLSTESTPADYLLSYAKTFGLYFYKDPYANRIFIRTRNKFFYPYVEDINDLIDRSKEMVTVPNVFNHKWYSMTQDQEDSKYEERYYNDWGVQYGQQRINTNYNFDSETQELMDNVFKGGITARERSSYLREYFLPDGTSAPSFFAEGYEQTLYGTGTTEHKEEIMSSVLDWSNVVDIYDVPAADATPKVCFYDKERKPIDMKDVLLFYNGKKSSYDKAGNQIVYWLTDDIGKMTVLNDGTCWLYTAQSTDALGETIAIPVTSLPMFTRVVIDENKVMKTMDFGDPKELYVDNWMLSERSSIYSQFWKDYLQDQYDVNTKVLTCYVHWDRKVIDDMQRRFYWFDNTIWVLNKIQDYDLAGDGATKCEFIRVNDPQAYTYGQLTAIPRIDTPTDVDGTRPAPAPSNLRRVKRSGDCPVIEFEDIITESYAVEAFDGNYDGYLDMCEAASVTDIGLTFKGTPIGLFDEFIYFTGIDTIPEGGFSGCTSLEHIVIPDNVTFIGGNAFYGDTNLEYIQILSSKPQTLGPGAFDNTRDCPIIVPCDYINSFREQWPQYANRLYCTVPRLRITPKTINATWDGGVYTIDITAQSVTGVTYSVYSGNLDVSVSISGDKGYITVAPNYVLSTKSGVIRIYGYDDYGLEVQDFLTINQDAPIPLTGLTLNVSDIIKEGWATTTVRPSDAGYHFVYSSSDDSVATVTTDGFITAQSNGQVEICVTDTITSISDCKTINAYKYATGITINAPDDVYGSAQIGYSVYPQGVDTNIVYSATGGTIDSSGLLKITCAESGVTVCVTDTLSGLSDCKTLTGTTMPFITRLYMRLLIDKPFYSGSSEVIIDDGTVVDENTPVITDGAVWTGGYEPMCSSLLYRIPGTSIIYNDDGLNLGFPSGTDHIVSGEIHVWEKKCGVDDHIRTVNITLPAGAAYKTNFTFVFKVSFSANELTNPSITDNGVRAYVGVPFNAYFNYTPLGNYLTEFRVVEQSSQTPFDHDWTWDGYGTGTTITFNNYGPRRLQFNMVGNNMLTQDTRPYPLNNMDLYYEDGLVKHTKCNVVTTVGAYKDVMVYNGDATGITLTVDDVIENRGQAYAELSPEGSFGTYEFISSDTSVATIDSSTGKIRVVSNGQTTISVRSISPSGLTDSKTITCILTPLTLEITADGIIKYSYHNGSGNKTLKYSYDGSAWTDIPSSGVSVHTGDEIKLMSTGNYNDIERITLSGSTAHFNAKGLLSSIYSDVDESSYPDFTFSRLFSGTHIVSADELLLPDVVKTDMYFHMFQNCRALTVAPALPATTLAQWCYYAMFDGCTSLTTAPELPATTLAQWCYYAMFDGCTSLTTAPALPATTLAEYCYRAMFRGCTSLTTAPVLSATTLAEYCCYSMFQNCTSLTTAPDLPAMTLAEGCYYHMFSGCSALTAAPALPATTLADYCYQMMFDGCTSLTTAPALLPAMTLAEKCYYLMFSGCTSLTAAPALPATTLANNCYDGMFNDCTSLTTAPALLPATTLAEYCYSGMFFGCTSLTTAPVLPATTLAHYCYNWMFNGCSSLTSAPALPATTLAVGCYRTMFENCGITTAPELPAKTMAQQCYEHMFAGCTSLTTAPELPAKTMAQQCYEHMFAGCTSLTTAPALPATTLAVGCYESMFENCGITTAPALPATTLAEGCYRGMFEMCWKLTTAPDLPATTLVNNCYRHMFYRCRKLNYIKCLATTNISNNCEDWVYNVSPTGTFVKKSGVNWSTGTSGIPSGWTVQECRLC